MPKTKDLKKPIWWRHKSSEDSEGEDSEVETEGYEQVIGKYFFSLHVHICFYYFILLLESLRDFQYS